jgi:predicted MFS family arabinose efflux permease
VPRDRYVEANSLVHGSRAMSFVAGPSLGGLLVEAVKAPMALVVDACSFLVSALFLRSIDPVEPEPEPPGSGHVMDGMRYIAHSPIVRASLLSTATINYFNFVFWAIFILYATRELDVDPGALGLVIGAGAVGGVIGAILAGRVSRRIGIGPAVMLGAILFPAPLVLVPLADNVGDHTTVLALLFLAEFGSGMGVMILDIGFGSVFAALIPHRMRARVSGAYTLVNYGVRPLGSLTGGALATAIGLQETLWIATLGACLGVLFLLPSPLARLHDLPASDEPGEPVGPDVPAGQDDADPEAGDLDPAGQERRQG